VVRIKICGNTRVEDILFEVKAGAHAVGMIHGFTGSPRNNDQSSLERLVRSTPPLAEPVVVTNTQGLAVVKRMGLRTVQLIAQPQDYPEIARLNPELKIIPVLYVGQDLPPDHVLKHYSEFEYVLVDTESKLKGGSGMVHNWKVSKVLSKIFGNVVLAGGLTPENVAEAISVVEPYGVDVSSGVESSPGKKDWGLVSRFIEAVRQVA